MHQTLSAPPPDVDAQEAADLAARHFGLEVADVRLLTAERDQNLRLKTADGRNWVMKLANPNEDPGLTDFQTQALVHLARAGGDLPLPRLLHAPGGAPSVQVELGDGRRSVMRVLSWVEGEPLSQVGRSGPQRRALARVLARLGQAFRGFSHPAQGAYMQWDIAKIDRIAHLLPHVPDAADRARVAEVLAAFEREVKPALPGLRRQVIYNDLNPFNVLVEPEDHDRISGIIDFGDITEAPFINDLAVAAAYQFGPEGGIEEVAQFIAAYAEVERPTEAEARLLPWLIACRLAMTLLITGYRAGLHPENAPYILRNAGPSRVGLASLLSRSPDQNIEWVFAALEESK